MLINTYNSDKGILTYYIICCFDLECMGLSLFLKILGLYIYDFPFSSLQELNSKTCNYRNSELQNSPEEKAAREVSQLQLQEYETFWIGAGNNWTSHLPRTHQLTTEGDKDGSLNEISRIQQHSTTECTNWTNFLPAHYLRG